MSTIISILLLLAVISSIGFSLYKLGEVKMPKWAKFKSTTPWGIKFFDKNSWLKILLIIFSQLIIIAIVFFAQILKEAYKTVAKKLLPKGIKV